MKEKVKKNSKKTIIERNQYTIDDRSKAKKYYLMGLNLLEISKLMNNISVRTMEKWQKNENWTILKEPEPLKKRVLDLQRSGKSYSEISEILNIHRSTVWRWLKQAKEIIN